MSFRTDDKVWHNLAALKVQRCDGVFRVLIPKYKYGSNGIYPRIQVHD